MVLTVTESRKNELVEKVKQYNPLVDVDLIETAYLFALEEHKDQQRRSGEDFIIHPLEVAHICADLGLDTATIVAAILHDVMEDASVDTARLESSFGAEVTQLVDGVTKLERIQLRADEGQAENLRKMMVAMARDLRVILIKLADRLHNMQTIEHLNAERQKAIARETLEIFAPLAHRLGIAHIKSLLEDEAFKVLEAEKYRQIGRIVADTRGDRQRLIDEAITMLQHELAAVGIEAEIRGRAKHFYSIWQKMKQQGKRVDQLHDISALRIITDSVRDCYAALGVVHSIWKPIPQTFNDYIAMPKFNMYQSLHTAVIGPQGKPFEIQIRTWDMHRVSEYGVAAHWRYKEGLKEPDAFEKRLSWLRQILEWESEYKDPREFMKALKMDLLGDEVFVFTPKGDVINLPIGSTPIDFAYAIHTEVGHRCVGAKVNGKIVPLDYHLHIGDIVEILTSKTAHGPSRDWLGMVRSSRARSKIRAWFSKEAKEDSISRGRELVMKVLRRNGLSGRISLDADELLSIGNELNQRTLDDLYASIGAGHISANALMTRLIRLLADREEPQEVEVHDTIHREEIKIPREVRGAIRVKGMRDVLVRLAHCCNPVPGDGIVGYVTRGRGISVHRADCPNIGELGKDAERFVDVAWEGRPSGTFQVEIQVEAVDRVKLLRDITTVLSDAGVNILNANLKTTKDGLAIFRFIFEIGNVSMLDTILVNVKKVDSVFDAHRL